MRRVRLLHQLCFSEHSRFQSQGIQQRIRNPPKIFIFGLWSGKSSPENVYCLFNLGFCHNVNCGVRVPTKCLHSDQPPKPHGLELLSLEKITLVRDALMRFVGLLYSILTLAVAWKLFEHFENATWYKPTNCRVDGNKVSDLEFMRRHRFVVGWLRRDAVALRWRLDRWRSCAYDPQESRKNGPGRWL